MPVEVRELVIRMAVRPDEPEGDAPPVARSRAGREELVAECVEQVLRILQERQER